MTRRKAVASILMSATVARTASGKASQPSTRLGFRPPPGACDCHTHIFADPIRYPFFEGRAYTPEPASPDEMKKLHGALQVSSVVIVQPSVYGTDNRATLYGMKAMGGLKRARGIAVISNRTPDKELVAMDRAGVRGIRLNNPAVTRESFQEAVTRIRVLQGWHIQLFTGLAAIQDLKPLILDSPVPVVIDHLASALPASGVNQAGFGDLVELVRTGKAYVKITHNFMYTSKSPMLEDAEALAKPLIAANPDRILWGTDWPHPNSASGRPAKEVSPLNQIDDGKMFNHFASWLQNDLRRVLVDNPAKLYGFR
jgi:predicted TIM-barrel fold metal-dependent hydrolase